VPLTWVAAEISKLPLWESPAAKALVANAKANVASMILENNDDFITAPVFFPAVRREPVEGGLSCSNGTFQFPADDLQFFAWV